jgi:secretion/DNA translocation related TadE-like protein
VLRHRNDTAPERLRDERGSVSVIIGGVVAIMIVLTLGAADLGTALIARERAHAAADAAALAAAQELAMPSGSLPQIQAADYADRNGALLVTCACEPGSREALVRVSVAIRHLFLVPGAHAVESQSRAVVDLP